MHTLGVCVREVENGQQGHLCLGDVPELGPLLFLSQGPRGSSGQFRTADCLHSGFACLAPAHCFMFFLYHKALNCAHVWPRCPKDPAGTQDLVGAGGQCAEPWLAQQLPQSIHCLWEGNHSRRR